MGATRESTLPLLAGLNNDHQGRRILALPLWAALQGLGKDGVHSRVRDDFLSSERLWAALDRYRFIRVLVLVFDKVIRLISIVVFQILESKTRRRQWQLYGV